MVDTLKRLFWIGVSIIAVRLGNALLNVFQLKPELWILEHAMSAPTQAWLEVARWALALGLAMAGWLIWKLYIHYFRDKPIPIAISEIKSSWFGNYAHFFESTTLEDNWLWNFGTVEIANISETKSVSLRIFLQLKVNRKEKPWSFKVLADGLGGPAGNLRYHQQKIIYMVKDEKNSSTTYNIVQTGEPAPNIVRCPLKLEAQQSIESQLLFIGDPELRESVLLKQNEIELSIVIDDHISGNQVTIPIPGSYRGK